MKKLSAVVSSLVLAGSFASANDAALLQKAKDFGLLPIPNSQLEILKLVDNPKNPITECKVELGKKLYFDPRLSKSGLISCNTCHNLGMGGADGVGAAVGHKWTPNPAHLNSPTVYNSVLNQAQFWDGRDPHLEAQAQGPVQAGPEMAAPKELVEARVNSMPGYVAEFKKVYGNDVKITFELITDTIAVFERTLITPSRFDTFMHGDLNSLTKEEKEGLTLFLDKGCAACHNDIGLGGTMQPFDSSKYDLNVGGFTGTQDGMIKTPTLRNIQETAPYFHNGNVWTLREAVKLMGAIQLGTKINDKEADKIVTFLNSLTGKKPAITYPQLPVITDKTPKPDFN
ncbi:MAG: cytochrome-c peroxidase [Arcobacteraceae bacterium]|jgi:cytochrome c peroxidase|nr:cytochrome-c peroxidase [Arcobacteraceae bacterium]MDY0364362.1 cytochrome-c peroxidase [Arcobacteraceae bacterium]